MSPLLLAIPAFAQTEGSREIDGDLIGVVTLRDRGGAIKTLDYEGTLRVRLHHSRIVIDVIGAGFVQDI